jgi:hypothetical protein
LPADFLHTTCSYRKRNPRHRIFTMFTTLLFLLVGFALLSVASTASSFDIETAEKRASELANLIYQRFEYHNNVTRQFFIEAANMPKLSWDIMKLKMAQKILGGGNSSFLMVFGGSSVTAGHDNFYNESWPEVFKRRMAPVFDAVGVELVVRNIAQGANNCRPADLCYEAMGGDNPDWIAWEQSFNCGKAKDVFELMARMASWYGGVVFYAASGAFIPSGCAPSTDIVPWTNEHWTPDNEQNQSKHLSLSPLSTPLYFTLLYSTPHVSL